MDNKITKKRINDHLEYDWYKYLLILICGIFLMVFVFSQINRTRDYEDVRFFISCYSSSNSDGFQTRATGDMQKESYDTDKYGEALLRDITFETQDPLGSNYSTLLQTHGMITSDVLIIGESILKNSGGFVEITDELLTDYLLPDGVNIDDLEYYYANEGTDYARRIGIKLSGFDNSTGEVKGSFNNLPFEFDWRQISSYKEKYESVEEKDRPDKNFYLVINGASVSIGKYAKKNTKNAQALYLVNRFIKYYKDRHDIVYG